MDIPLTEIDNKNILLAGNKVLYTINHINEGCFGVVINTGFYTKRGESVRSLLVQKSSEFLYIKDAIFYYIIMTSIAVTFSIIYLLYEKFYIGIGNFVYKESLIKIF